MNCVVLNKGRERSVLRRHPWIFSGAIESGVELPEGLVAVESACGDRIGYGYLSPRSQIRVRMLTFDPVQMPDDIWLESKLASVIAVRGDFAALAATNAARRLINAENDGLPGVVADVYAGHVVLQLTSAFAAAKREQIVSAFIKVGAKSVSEREDVDVRVKEGLPVGGFTLLAGEAPPETVEIVENGVRMLVDIRKGHKTGYYLDQRTARYMVKSYARGEMLNCFSYTGGFGLFAAQGGATKVYQIDVSSEALRLARENAALNGFADDRFEYVEADVFKYLRGCRDAGRSFDTIVLDPPKFAETKSQIMRAARGYKDINLLAMKLLKPGGILATFSCSSAMTSELFDKVIAEAATDARRDLRILARTMQADDHPVSVHFPEGQYLKGLLLQAE